MHPITQSENTLFERLSGAAPYERALYRDGAPAPALFSSQARRVLFVFREPNLPDMLVEGSKYANVDMRVQLLDTDPELPTGSARGWWRNKVGAFAHAVLSSASGADPAESFRRFEVERDAAGPAPYLQPFAYMQLKKLGGVGVSDRKEIAQFAKTQSDALRDQIAIYDPDVIIGCGVGAASPAALLREHVLLEFLVAPVVGRGFRYWPTRAPDGRARVLLEVHHPSARTSRQSSYETMCNAFSAATAALRV